MLEKSCNAMCVSKYREYATKIYQTKDHSMVVKPNT